MPSKRNATLVKPLEGSTMIHEESEDMSFRVSWLEDNMRNMEQIMEKKLEEGMDKIVNLI